MGEDGEAFVICQKVAFIASTTALVGLTASPQSSEPGTFRDPRGGQVYATIEIAGTTWFGRDLAFETHRSFCYGDDPAFCEKHGRLYRWEDALAACPPGWHLPTEYEWQGLEHALGIPEAEITQERNRGTTQGGRLKRGGDTGFETAYGGWRRSEDGVYEAAGRNAAWWTANESDLERAWHRDVDTGDDQVWRSPVVKQYGLSVRCVKDAFVADRVGSVSDEALAVPNSFHPDVSPDGRFIAFDTDRDGMSQIYFMKVDGTGVRRLTRSWKPDTTPVWSRDGRRIVFSSGRDGGPPPWPRYSIDLDGSRVRELSENADRFRAYSSDGSRMLIAEDRNLFVANADGSNRSQLTTSERFDSDQSFSPAGARILYESFAHDPGDAGVYVMALDGSGKTRLADGTDPRWSPNGTRISYKSSRPDDRCCDIYVMRSDGTENTLLAEKAFIPRWLPDGSKIVYFSEISGSYQIYSVNPDGSEVRQLTGQH